MNKILQEALKSSPSTIIDVYIADISAIYPEVQPIYFFSGVNSDYTEIVWQGKQYTAYPVSIEGFEWSGQGRLPTPKARLANINGFITALNMEYNDLIGAKITRKRTFLKYLDAINFEGGVNPEEDPSVEFPTEVYFIDRKSSENSTVVEYELVSALDISGVQIPKRLIIQNLCLWKYRGPECGYTGTIYFDENGKEVVDASKDICGHRLSDCKKRFNSVLLTHGIMGGFLYTGGNNPLNFGGFPGASLTI